MSDELNDCQMGECPSGNPHCEGCESEFDEMEADAVEWAEACIKDLELEHEVEVKNLAGWFARVLNARCVKGPAGPR